VEGTGKFISTLRIMFSLILILIMNGCKVSDVRDESTQETTQISMRTSTEMSLPTEPPPTDLPKITPVSTSSPTEESEAVVREVCEADGESCCPSISEDGRYVAYISWASNIVEGDNNEMPDVFIYDVQTQQMVRVSVASDGSEGNFGACYSMGCEAPAISADGRYVAFTSWSDNLIEGDTNEDYDVFLHDRDTDEDGIFDEPGAIRTFRVSVASDGTELKGEVDGAPDISADGRYVTFKYISTGADPGIEVVGHHILVHDLGKGITTVVTSEFTEDTINQDPLISSDGRYILFESYSRYESDHTLYIHDLLTSKTFPTSFEALHQSYIEWGCARTEEGCVEPGMMVGDRCIAFSHCSSSDGRYVAFTEWDVPSLNPLESWLDSLCDENLWFLHLCDLPDEVEAVFVYDRDNDQISRVSTGLESKWGAERPTISNDGRYVAFEAWGLGDFLDVIVYDRMEWETIIVSVGLICNDER
jgi:Tol biopolymer transport system component